jgi:phage baseplate assembly protein W
MKGFSPKFPLEKGNLVGTYMLNTTFKDMIKQNLKNLLLTNQGERVMDVKFGVGLRSYFFEPKIPATMGNIAQKIQKQTQKYMPFIRVSNIDFSGTENENLLGIQITYEIPALQETDLISIDSVSEEI